MAGTYTEWVRQRGDDDLVALLAARPDLGTPAPSSLRSLAARAASRTSTERAVAHLDAGALAVLESLVALGADGTPVPVDALTTALGTPDAAAAVRRVLDRARPAALVWDDGDGLRPAPGLAEVLGPYPAGLGPLRPADGPDATAPPPAPPLDLPRADPAEQQVLDALAWGPPVGVVPAPGTTARAAVDGLVAAGLLLRSDARHVLLPHDVGLALRAGRTHRDPPLVAPRPHGRHVPAAVVDAESASAALEAVRLVARLVTAWDDDPPRTLRAGGLTVRDLRRLAADLETDETTASVVVELAAGAGLVADDGDSPASYVATLAADRWEEVDDADRWATLALAWSASRRTPWQVGSRDEKGTVRAPLSPDLHRPWVPRLRADVLDVLAAQPGTALDVGAVMEVLRWRSPRSVPPEAAVAGLLREAALLGVTGAGVLSTPGAVLTGGTPGTGQEAGAEVARAVLAEHLRAALPAEVHEVLLQGDLTGIVPGRPDAELARLLAAVADVESRGAATTVRFSTASVTRALDHGTSGDELLAELARRSPVPVPQPLEYLVRDTARRHEALRVGAVQAYVRAADPAVLAGLVEDPRLAGLGLVRLAPTVLGAAVPAAELHEVLRGRGLLSALEGPDGRAVGRRARPSRVDRRAPRAPAAVVRGTDDAARAAVVARMRGTAVPPEASATPGPGGAPSSDGAPVDTGPAATAGTPSDPVTSPGDALALLHEAIRDGRQVWIEMAGRTGALERRALRPLRLDGGRLRALDADREAELTVAVHRIASVEPV
ncbi:XPB/Ssl2-like helicase family protein [Isoptericola jiangsuensis]|uniref:XPB/Ssl2-like helicase family protein n=1 Tax=Isoptericola jiangsuensis TaxID=548579 RepID=A0A2A9F0P1_9MICO|nr:helicase-associated domain-containing protein [Isoptericola jiangsuensis]PFG44346.1 XPB/Ssl2-like helicase family protein [Isoptericola jiangsuensis]